MKLMHKTVDLRNINKNAKKNFPYIFFIFIFLLGLLLSVYYIIIINGQSVQNTLSDIPISQQEIFKFIKQFTINGLILIAISFISGFCAVGMPIQILDMLVCSIQIGTMVIQYCMQENQCSLPFAFIVFIPSAICFSISLMSANIQSSFISTDLFRSFMIQTDVQKINIRTYLTRYILIIKLFLLSICWLLIVGSIFIRCV